MFVLVLILVCLIFAMIKPWLRHQRANRSLDILKSYVDQGKEPPAILLQTLQVAHQDDGLSRIRGPRGWTSIFLFAGLAAAFTFMASRDSWDEGHIFIAIIMGGVALGSLVTKLATKHDDRIPPP